MISQINRKCKQFKFSLQFFPSTNRKRLEAILIESAKFYLKKFPSSFNPHVVDCFAQSRVDCLSRNSWENKCLDIELLSLCKYFLAREWRERLGGWGGRLFQCEFHRKFTDIMEARALFSREKQNSSSSRKTLTQEIESRRQLTIVGFFIGREFKAWQRKEENRKKKIWRSQQKIPSKHSKLK